MDAIRVADHFTTTRRACAALLIMAGLAAGCVAHRGQSLVDLPVRHSVRAQRLIVHSDLPVAEDSRIVRELEELRLDVLSTLALPEPKRPVVVYLFEDEARYSSYMKRHFPKLPSRRAFFVGSATELAVYAFHGDHLATDLRHEYTHGVLHAGLRNIPLWLDEGLAEYFETAREDHRVNHEHLERLSAAMAGGWQPDLERLEQLTDVSEMQAMDYHEAWAWVYSWLQSDEDDERQQLVKYIHRLRETTSPQKLSQTPGLEKNEAARRVLKQLAVLSGEEAPGPFPNAAGRAKFDDAEVIPANASDAKSP